MSDSDTIVKEEVITIKLDKFLMPVSILLSALILSAGLLAGLNNIAGAVKTMQITTTGTTTTGTTDDKPVTASLDQIKQIFQGDYIKFGDANSKVLFVEFSDPSCPYCHIASGKNSELNSSAGSQFLLVSDGGTYVAPVPEMKKMVDSGQAAYAWVYVNGHGNGEMGTKALYCANEQGKFWEAHDRLMTSEGYALLNDNVKNDSGKSGDLANFLSNATDSGALKSCLDSGKYDSRISSDQSLAASYGAQGTPNFFVNDSNFPGAYNWTDIQSTVSAALQ